MARQPNKRDPYTGAAEVAGGNLDTLALIQSVLGAKTGGPGAVAEASAPQRGGDNLPDGNEQDPNAKQQPAGASYSYLAAPQQTVAEGIKRNLEVDARNKMMPNDRIAADTDAFFQRNASALGDPNAPMDMRARQNTIRTMQGLGLNPVDHSGGVNMGPDRELPQMGARERQRADVVHADRSSSGVPMPVHGSVRAATPGVNIPYTEQQKPVPMSPSSLSVNNPVAIGTPPPAPQRPTVTAQPAAKTVAGRQLDAMPPGGGDVLDNAHIMAFFKKLLSGGYQHPGP